VVDLDLILKVPLVLGDLVVVALVMPSVDLPYSLHRHKQQQLILIMDLRVGVDFQVHLLFIQVAEVVVALSVQVAINVVVKHYLIILHIKFTPTFSTHSMRLVALGVVEVALVEV
jgi:hypothetical protein